MKYAPIKVNGDFDCSNNDLDSLEGAPKEVTGKFICNDNTKITKEMIEKLLETSNIKRVITNFGIFKGKKKKKMKLYSRKDFLNEGKFDKLFGVKVNQGYLDLSDKNITELVNVPNEINGHFYCYNNQLTSLEGAPNIVDGGFYCYGNQLTSLEGAPIKTDTFDCSRNNLDSLEGAPDIIDGNFKCTYNEKITKEMLLNLRKTSKISGIIYSDLGEF